MHIFLLIFSFGVNFTEHTRILDSKVTKRASAGRAFKSAEISPKLNWLFVQA